MNFVLFINLKQTSYETDHCYKSCKFFNRIFSLCRKKHQRSDAVVSQLQKRMLKTF